MNVRTAGLVLAMAIEFAVGPPNPCGIRADERISLAASDFPPLREPEGGPPQERGSDVTFPPPAEPRLDPLLAPSSVFPTMYPLAAGTADDRTPLKTSSSFEGTLGALTSSVVVSDRATPLNAEDPLWKRTWQTNEAWRCTLGGPLFVFGQLGASSEEASQSDMKVAGRTGLACTLPVGAAGEVRVRAGPGLSYVDPLRPDRTREQADWQVEVMARYALLRGIGLEYQGVAVPALTPLAQDQFNHDVRLAFPVGGAGQFQLGARYHWTNTTDSRPPTDSMQLYLGLQFAH